MACLAALDHVGIDAAVISGLDEPASVPLDKIFQISLIDIDSITETKASESVRRCMALQIPVIALIPESNLQDFDVSMDVDDIVVTPPSTPELVLRVRRVLSDMNAAHDHLIRAGNLVINPTSYDVTLNGIQLNLRFKEYELLLLLATNPGRVFSREALLSRIWSYQYYGGIRTVDVHIRRLRSKLQDSAHQFIEAVWNVGYRFRNSA
jgi:DNA-binding response OmpR family regulator